jgi:hypothetical protein
MQPINVMPSTCDFINLSYISAMLCDGGMDDLAEQMHGFLDAADTAADEQGSIGLHLVKIPGFIKMLYAAGMEDTSTIEYILHRYDHSTVFININN